MAKPYDFETACTRRVSYILLTKDRASFLPSALDNIRQFKTADDELIVIDGGSADETLSILAAARDVVDVTVSEPDISEGHAANKGYLLSRGRYVKELTDDDEIHPQAMAQAIAVLDSHPAVKMLVCGGTKSWDGGIQTIYLPPGTNYGQSADDVFRFGTCGIGWLIRKSLFARIGLMNAKAVSLDRDYTAYAIAAGANVKFCRINLYHHPVLPHSYSTARKGAMDEDALSIVNRYASPAFARYYRWRTTMARFADARLIRGIAGLIRLMKRRGSRHTSEPPSPVWDGGFS